jgi:hypothetical protein
LHLLSIFSWSIFTQLVFRFKQDGRRIGTASLGASIAGGFEVPALYSEV